MGERLPPCKENTWRIIPFSKWLITMVRSFSSPKDRVVVCPIPKWAKFMAYKWGWSDHHKNDTWEPDPPRLQGCGAYRCGSLRLHPGGLWVDESLEEILSSQKKHRGKPLGKRRSLFIWGLFSLETTIFIPKKHRPPANLGDSEPNLEATQPFFRGELGYLSFRECMMITTK